MFCNFRSYKKLWKIHVFHERKKTIEGCNAKMSRATVSQPEPVLDTTGDYKNTAELLIISAGHVF